MNVVNTISEIKLDLNTNWYCKLSNLDLNLLNADMHDIQK